MKIFIYHAARFFHAAVKSAIILHLYVLSDANAEINPLWRDVTPTDASSVLSIGDTLLLLLPESHILIPWLATKNESSETTTWVEGLPYSPECVTIFPPTPENMTSDNSTDPFENTSTEMGEVDINFDVSEVECQDDTVITFVASAQYGTEVALSIGQYQLVLHWEDESKGLIYDNVFRLPINDGEDSLLDEVLDVKHMAMSDTHYLFASKTMAVLIDWRDFIPIWTRTAADISNVDFLDLGNGLEPVIFPRNFTVGTHTLTDVLEVTTNEKVTAYRTIDTIYVWEELLERMTTFDGAYDKVMAVCCTIVVGRSSDGTTTKLMGPPELPAQVGALTAEWPNKFTVAAKTGIYQGTLCPVLPQGAVSPEDALQNPNVTMTDIRMYQSETSDCSLECHNTWPCAGLVKTESEDTCWLTTATDLTLCLVGYTGFFGFTHQPLSNYPVIAQGEVIAHDFMTLITRSYDPDIAKEYFSVRKKDADLAWQNPAQVQVEIPPPLGCNACGDTIADPGGCSCFAEIGLKKCNDGELCDKNASSVDSICVVPPSCSDFNGEQTGSKLKFNVALKPGERCSCGQGETFEICYHGDWICDSNASDDRFREAYRCSQACHELYKNPELCNESGSCSWVDNKCVVKEERRRYRVRGQDAIPPADDCYLIPGNEIDLIYTFDRVLGKNERCLCGGNNSMCSAGTMGCKTDFSQCIAQCDEYDGNESGCTNKLECTYTSETNDCSVKMWRDDERCGPDYPLADGKTPSECNPNGNYCCSKFGWCGKGKLDFCCDGCRDYRYEYVEATCPEYPEGITSFDLASPLIAVGFAKAHYVRLLDSTTFAEVNSFLSPCAPKFVLIVDKNNIVSASESEICLHRLEYLVGKFFLQSKTEVEDVTAVSRSVESNFGYIVGTPDLRVTFGNFKNVRRIEYDGVMTAVLHEDGVTANQDRTFEFEGKDFGTIAVLNSLIEPVLLATRVAFGMQVEVISLMGSLDRRYRPTSNLYFAQVPEPWDGAILALTLDPGDTIIDQYGMCVGTPVHSIADKTMDECEAICNGLWNCHGATWEDRTCSLVEVIEKSWCADKKSIAYVRVPVKKETLWFDKTVVAEGEVFGFTEDLMLLKNDLTITTWIWHEEWINSGTFDIVADEKLVLVERNILIRERIGVISVYNWTKPTFVLIHTLPHSCGGASTKVFHVTYPQIVVSNDVQWCGFNVTAEPVVEVADTTMVQLGVFLNVTFPTEFTLTDVKQLDVHGEEFIILVDDAIFVKKPASLVGPNDLDSIEKIPGAFSSVSIGATPNTEPMMNVAVGIEDLYGYPAMIHSLFPEFRFQSVEVKISSLYTHPRTAMVSTGHEWRSFRLAVDGTVYSYGFCWSNFILQNEVTRWQCKLDCDKIAMCVAATWQDGQCRLSSQDGKIELCQGEAFVYVKPPRAATETAVTTPPPTDLFLRPIELPEDDERKFVETEAIPGEEILFMSDELMIFRGLKGIYTKYWDDGWIRGDDFPLLGEVKAIVGSMPLILISETLPTSLTLLQWDNVTLNFVELMRVESAPCGFDLIAIRNERIAYAEYGGILCLYGSWELLYEESRGDGFYDSRRRRRMQAADTTNGNDIGRTVFPKSQLAYAVEFSETGDMYVGTKEGLLIVDGTTLEETKLQIGPVEEIRNFGPVLVVRREAEVHVLYNGQWQVFPGRFTSVAAAISPTGDLIVVGCKYYLGMFEEVLSKINTHVETLSGGFDDIMIPASHVHISLGTTWASLTFSLKVPVSPFVPEAYSTIVQKGLCFESSITCSAGSKKTFEIERGDLSRPHCREACDFVTNCKGVMWRRSPARVQEDGTIVGAPLEDTCILLTGVTWKWCAADTFAYRKEVGKNITVDLHDGDLDIGQIGGMIRYSMDASYHTHFLLALVNSDTGDHLQLCNSDEPTPAHLVDLPCLISAHQYPANISVEHNLPATFDHVEIQALHIGAAQNTDHVIRSDISLARIRDCTLTVSNLQLYDATDTCGEIGGFPTWDIEWHCVPEDTRATLPSLLGYELILRPEPSVSTNSSHEVVVAFMKPQVTVDFQESLYYHREEGDQHVHFPMLYVYPHTEVGRAANHSSLYVVDLGTQPGITNLRFSDADEAVDTVRGCLQWDIRKVKHAACLAYHRIMYKPVDKPPVVLGYVDVGVTHFNIPLRRMDSSNGIDPAYDVERDLETWEDRLDAPLMPPLQAPPKNTTLVTSVMTLAEAGFRVKALDVFCNSSAQALQAVISLNMTWLPAENETTTSTTSTTLASASSATTTTTSTTISSTTTTTEQSSCPAGEPAVTHPLFSVDSALLWRIWNVTDDVAWALESLMVKDAYECSVEEYTWPRTFVYDLVLKNASCMDVNWEKNGDLPYNLTTCDIDMNRMSIDTAKLESRFHIHCMGVTQSMMEKIVLKDTSSSSSSSQGQNNDFCTVALLLERPQTWKHSHVPNANLGARVKECSVNMWIQKPQLCRHCSMIMDTDATSRAGCFVEHRDRCATREYEVGMYKYV